MVSGKWRYIELVAGVLLFLFCITVGLAQPVNPFPEDGWFASRSRIFEHHPGGDNYIPVAVPALFYAGTYAIRTLMGWSLEGEFYLGAFLHQLLLFGTAVLVYLSHRVLGFRMAGMITTAILVSFIESTLTTQAFWSENVTIFLMSAVLFTGLVLFQDASLSESRFQRLSILFGLLVAGLVITRFVPLLILPGMILLLSRRLPPARTRRFAVIASSTVMAVALAAMGANLYRYGRFELSDSAGRHLWNVLSPNADVMLAESPEYELLKKEIPDVQGREWWEVDELDFGPDLTHFTREQLMRKMVLHGIARHPFLFLKQGGMNFQVLLLRCPARLGLHRSLFNPLKRESLLPPLAADFPAIDRALSGFHWFFQRIYGALVIGALAAAFLALVFGRKTELLWTVLFFAYVFLASLYVTGQIEEPDGRYVLLLFPVLAMLASSSVVLLIETARLVRES